MDFVDRAIGYAHGVIDGSVGACEFTKQACQRQLDDLQRDDWEYEFRASAANRVCDFVSMLPHVKGEWAGKEIALGDWQCFIYTTFFGWVRKSDGVRRFRTSYVEVPRKNAKSTMSSGVALYCLTADKEAGAEVYSAATHTEQARIVFDDARVMVDHSPELRKALGVTTLRHSVFVESTASIFKPLSRESGGNLDGLNIHCAVIDELHAHKDRGIYEVIETATGSRRQSVLLVDHDGRIQPGWNLL